MNRADLGPFGVGMADAEFAQALAAFGIWANASYRWPGPSLSEVEEALRQQIGDGFVEVAAWWLRGPVTGQDAALFAQAWRNVFVGRTQPLRIEVGAGVPEHISWLWRQLIHPSVGAVSVYQRFDNPDRPVAWQWPLRLGVLGPTRTARHKQLTSALENVHHRNLWTVVDMQQPGVECELLLLAGDLRQSLIDVLDAPHRPRADCVLVLNSRQLPADRALAMATAIRREARTAGVALLSLGLRIEIVLTALVAELSHDKTIDVALAEAVRNANRYQGVQLPAPELMCSRALAIHTSVRLTAARMARDFSPAAMNIPMASKGFPSDVLLQASPSGVGPTLEASTFPDANIGVASKELVDLVRSGEWLHESSDASRLVDILREQERTTGQLHRAAPMSSSASAPQPVSQPDDRQVLAQVFEREVEDPIRGLRGRREYRLRVRIDIPDQNSVAAGASFPSRELPDSPTGHTLDVAFVPLAADGEGERAPAQQAQLFLPPTGTSTECQFVFSTHGVGSDFSARLLISYANRILQTLRLDASLTTDDDNDARPYQLSVENVVQSGFQNLAYQQPFDAAFVANHSVDGQSGITAMAGGKVTFLQPEGMSEAIKLLQDTITDNTALQQADGSLDSPVLGKLIYALMEHGHVLYDLLATEIGALDKEAGRIQLVEARPGATFPVEYLYPLALPLEQPPMCPHAGSALKAEANALTHQECPHRDDSEYMCPMRFWGFRKQVERQPASIKPSDGSGGVATLLTPSVLQGRLDLLNSVQVGRSTKVKAVDYDLPDGLLKVLQDNFAAVHAPTSWVQWKGSIQEQSPGLLLLLSHSDRDEFNGLPALEISSQMLSLGKIEASFVKGPLAKAPVVFLFGCSTADSSLGFMNFVDRFKRKEAALVVGTMSTISAQRAVRFLALALPIFKEAQNSGRTFGEVFLQVKRAALADGDGFALTLVAYGDCAWQL